MVNLFRRQRYNVLRCSCQAPDILVRF